MLDKDKIAKNTKKYFETATKHGFMTEELTTFLGIPFMTAPASTMKDLHNAFEGGLVDHLLRTTKFAVSINSTLPDNIKLPVSEVIKVCLLYQIGKAHAYKPCMSEWHKTNQGKMYEFNEEAVAMRVGERSAFYAISHGVKLTEAEYQAIINHDKDDSDKQAKYRTSPLGVILKQANEWAIIEEKTPTNESN